MKTKTKIVVSLTALLMSTFSFGKQGLSDYYELIPGVQVSMDGNLLSSKKQDCTVRSESLGNTIHFYSSHKDNVINGILLKENMNVDFVAPVNSHFYIEMEPRARLEVTNLSEGIVNLSCQ